MQGPAPSPPVGFRKAIPTVVKLQVVLAQGSICTDCGERLGELGGVQFDHVPAIQLRGWDPVRGDTIPACNDPTYIEAKHKDCHKAKTTGRRGESKLSHRGGDTTEIAKLRRISKDHEEFRKKMLSKADPEIEVKEKPKSRWPKRELKSNASWPQTSKTRGRKSSRGSGGE